jgi:hypothetical protein
MNTVDLEEIVRESIRKALLKEGPSRREYHAAAIDAAFDKFGPFKKGDSVVNAEGDVGVVQKWDAAAEELHGKPLGPDELAVYWQKRRENTIERIEDLAPAPERGSQGDRPSTAPIDPDDLHEDGETNLKGDEEMNLEEIVRSAIRTALEENKPLQEAESVGHHAVIDGEFYVDSNFLNKLNTAEMGAMGYLEHVGMGDFSFNSEDGKETRFMRGGKDIPGQVGRSHSVYSHPPEFIEDIVDAMEQAGHSETPLPTEEPPPDLEEKKYRREDEEEDPLDEAHTTGHDMSKKVGSALEMLEGGDTQGASAALYDVLEDLESDDPQFNPTLKEAEEEELTPKQKKEMDKDNDGDIDDDDMDILQGKEKNEGKQPPWLKEDEEEEKVEEYGRGLGSHAYGDEGPYFVDGQRYETLGEAEAAARHSGAPITDSSGTSVRYEGLNKDLEEAPNKEWYEDQLFESLMKKWAK